LHCEKNIKKDIILGYKSPLKKERFANPEILQCTPSTPCYPIRGTRVKEEDTTGARRQCSNITNSGWYPKNPRSHHAELS